MTGRETDFIPNYPLFFTHKGRRKLFELLGVKTQKAFMAALNDMEKGDGVPDEVYEKIIYAGLVWLNKPDLTLDAVSDLMETYYKMGNSAEDLETCIVDAYTNSGLYDKNVVAAYRKKKQEQIDAVLKMIDNQPIEIPLAREAGQGNPIVNPAPVTIPQGNITNPQENLKVDSKKTENSEKNLRKTLMT